MTSSDLAARRWCHASCCSGETAITGPYGPHDAQLFLDRVGAPIGAFGELHASLVRLLVAMQKPR